MTHTTYKFRLYPTEEQALSLTQMIGAQRALWNVALQQRINRLKYPKSAGLYPNYYSQAPQLTELRSEYDWVRAVPATFQQELLRDLDKAWSSFLSKSKSIPRFKSRYRNPVTGLTSNQASILKFTHFNAWVPTLGWVKMRSHRRLKGRPVKMTVLQDVDQWFVAMNHINEGLLVLSAIGANLETKRAWCLHPIFQNDDDLAANWLRYEFDYRVTQVNQMLKADKIQNYKDLVTYGVDHPNFMGLVAYFHTWFGMLGIDERFRDHLMKVCHAGD